MQQVAPKGTVYPEYNPYSAKARPSPNDGLSKEEKCCKYCLRNWADETTWHGVKDMHNSSRPGAKLFWALIVIVCLLTAGVQIFGLVSAFVTPPHYVTNIYLQDANVNEFPNITICSLNRINRTLARQLNMSKNAISYLFLSQPVMADITTFEYAPHLLEQHRQEWLHFVNTSGLPSHDPWYLFRWLGHQCRDLMSYCYFHEPFDCCDAKYAKAVVNPDYGLCWSITPPVIPPASRPVQSFPGSQNGFKTFIMPGLQDYATDVMFNNYLESGVVVNLDFNPYQMMPVNPIQISPGMRASIGLRNKIRTTAMPRYEIFKRPCEQNGTVKFLKGPYTYQTCIEECYQDVIHRACNCLIVSEIKSNISTCSPDQMMECAMPAATENFSEFDKDGAVSNDCMSECLEPCEQGREVEYTITTSVFTDKNFITPVTDLMNSIGWPVTEEMISSMIAINLYFPSRGFTVVEKSEKTPLFELIGNIGGQMGLWMGASIVTIIQALYYICNMTLHGKRNAKSCD